MNTPPHQSSQLIIVLRVEPGCLGPDGKDRVDDFCIFAQPRMQLLDFPIRQCDIVPRHDKTLPEIQYGAVNKTLSHEQAAKYLEVFGSDIDELESDLQDRLASLIGDFLEQ